MANQYDQNGTQADYQNEQRGRNNPSSSPAQYQQGHASEFGSDERFGGQSDFSRNDRGGDYGREQGRWAGGRPDNEIQGYRDPSFPPPPIYYGGERGRDQQGPWGQDRGYDPRHQGGYGPQRQSGSGQGYGRPEGGFGQRSFDEGGGYAQSSYGQGGYTQGGYGQGYHRGGEQRDVGQIGFGPSRSGQEQAMQGLSYYDQDYSSPFRGAYGGGGYGRDEGQGRGPQSGYRGQGMQGYGGYRQSGYGMDDDGPNAGDYLGAGGYLGDTDRGNWARGVGGEGRGGSSMGYSAQGRGGSGSQQSSSRGGFRGLGPSGYKRSDERLCEDINERLTDDDHIDASGISVDVKEGVVTLSGEVDERRLKHRVEDMVERCHGVQDIRNEIRVKRSGGQSGARSGSGSSSGASGHRSSGGTQGTSGGTSTSGSTSGQSSLSSSQRSSNGNDESSSTDPSGASAASRKK